MAGGSLPRGGKSEYFRRLSELAPEDVRTRVTQFIESVAYKSELPGAIGESVAATTPAAHDHSKYALEDHSHTNYAIKNHSHPTSASKINLNDLSDVSFGLVTPGELLVASGFGGWSNRPPWFGSDQFVVFDSSNGFGFNFNISTLTERRTASAVDAPMTIPPTADWLDLTDGGLTYLHTHDHDYLYGAGYYMHYEIDFHIDDDTIHFTEGSISHLNIQDIGTYAHADIDSHLDDLGNFHDHGNLTGLADDDHLQYLQRTEWYANGFVDRADTTLAWDDGTRTLTLAPAVTSFDYYYAGYKYTETGSLAATITDTEGLWVFYIGSGGAAVLSTIHNPTYDQVEQAIDDECIVAYVYWDATNNDGRLLGERHGAAMPPAVHHYLHELFGAQYSSGMTLGDILVDQAGSADTHAQFSITAGKFYDEDLGHETLAHASTDTWECYYVNGSGDVRWVDCEATFPVAAVGGVIAWNSAGTLTPADNNKYICYHVFATNIHTDAGGDYYPVVTPGIVQYGSKAAAQDAALSEIQAIDFGDWPTEEIIPVATVIFKHLATMSNGVEAAIQSTEGGGDFVDWRFTAVSGSSTSVNDHGALSGLSDDDHPQYLLAAAATDRATFGTNWVDLTDAGATTLHKHSHTGLDDIGTNTHAQIDTFIGTTVPATYLPLAGGTLTGNLIVQKASPEVGMIGTSYTTRYYQTGSNLELGILPNGGATYDALVVRPGARPQYYTSAGGGVSDDLVISGDLSSYLPLTAGSGKPLSGDLYVQAAGTTTIFVRKAASATDYGKLMNDGSYTFLRGYAAGNAGLAFDAVSGATSTSDILFHRYTTTSGVRKTTFYLGDGTGTVQHTINSGTGNVDLCQQGGTLTVGGTELLPLTAGSGKPLSGNLYIDTASAAALLLRANGDASDYAIFKDEGPAAYFNKVAASGNALFYFNAQPSDNTSQALVEFFRATNTSGARIVRFYVGNNTGTVQHLFNAGTGVVNLCQQGGGLKVSNGYVQLPYLAGAPASPENGMIWMESDGLHLYYAGAEKLVAGV